MSVIGIDFGTDSCYIAVARAGGIETITNDFSLRATPSIVSFGEKCRAMGVSAKNQQTTNLKNTVGGFKRLLGRKFQDPLVKEEKKLAPYQIVSSDKNIGIKVQLAGEQKIFTPEQLTAMLFTKLKETAEAALKTKMHDCVVSVPQFFTDAERRGLLSAVTAAGLNPLKILNDTTATALSYGIYKQDLPAPEEKPRHVVFVDFGYSSLQVAIVAFHKGKLKVLSTVADSNLGGRNFDYLLIEHFCNEFKKTYKLDARNNPRAIVRLKTEVEKLKKQMSANSMKLPFSVECLMNDTDVQASMKRSDFEEMCADLLQRVEDTLRKAQHGIKLPPSEIYSVEVVGGSTRIPAVKQLIEKVFNKPPSTTLNLDEAVARGCALQCAMLSPTFRVRDFSITDVQPYPIDLLWKADMSEEGRMEVFPIFHQVPFSKMLTFYRKEPFTLRAQYNSDIPYPDKYIGDFTVKDVKPTPENESSKVKVKVRVNLHGIFTVSSATLMEKKDTTEEEPMEVEVEGEKQSPVSDKQSPENESSAANEEQNEMNIDQQNGEDVKTEAQSEAPAEKESQEKKAEVKKEDKKKKNVLKSVDLPIEAQTLGISKAELDHFTELEAQMVAHDRLEKDRQNAKNSVEEYVYDVRSRISDENDLYLFVLDTSRDQLILYLEDTENWLYEEGEDCQKQIYLDKLEELKGKFDPIKNRKLEWTERPAAFEAFGRSIQLASKIVSQFRSGDEKYSHLDSAEVEKVEKTLQEKQEWLHKNMQSTMNLAKWQEPPVHVAHIRSELQLFENSVSPTLNKPKPKPPKVEEPPPPPAPSDQNATQQEKKNKEGDVNSKVNNKPSDKQNEKSEEQMDLD